MRQKTYEKITIHGIVTPCDWDEKGNIIGLTVSTSNEEEYLIDGSPKGKELLKYLHKQVKVTGQAMVKGTSKAIKVERYEIVPTSYEELKA